MVIDMEGLTLTHVSYFSPSFARSVVEYVRRSLPCRLKGVHIVNASYLFDMVFAFFKPFLQVSNWHCLKIFNWNIDGWFVWINNFRENLEIEYISMVLIDHQYWIISTRKLARKSMAVNLNLNHLVTRFLSMVLLMMNILKVIVCFMN